MKIIYNYLLYKKKYLRHHPNFFFSTLHKREIFYILACQNLYHCHLYFFFLLVNYKDERVLKEKI